MAALRPRNALARGDEVGQHDRVFLILPWILLVAADLHSPPAERVAAFGVGGALEHESGSTSGGAAAFVEYEAWSDRLELELGAQALGKSAGREYSFDLVFKWPHSLTERLEIMIGAGPTLTASAGDRVRWGVEGAVDLMWWPLSPVGFWVEPSVELVVRGHSMAALGATAGPMIGW